MKNVARLKDELFSKLEYDREAGEFIWLPRLPISSVERRFNTLYAGKIAGSVGEKGYKTICLRVDSVPEYYTVHRLVWLFETGVWPIQEIDHIDGDKLNNKFSNLREVSKAVNLRNKPSMANNTSGVTGVRFRIITYKDRDYAYWVVTWNDLNTNPKTKSFSVNSYGEQEAFRLACEYRKKMIELLNEQGAGYTERHGG